MQRHLMGLIALAFLGGGGWFWITADSVNDPYVSIAGMGMRVGAVLAAVWLALPQLESVLARVPPWLAGAVGLVLLIVAVKPRTILLLGPLLIALAALQGLKGVFGGARDQERGARGKRQDKQGRGAKG